MRLEAFITNPKTLVSALLVPTGLIAIASCGLIPWLLETRGRLDNNYWETQLLFATIALGAVCVALPALILRATGRLDQTAIVWVMTMIGYGMVALYIVQSHFPLVSKLVIAAFSILFITICSVGWRIERAKKTGGEQDDGDQTPTAVDQKSHGNSNTNPEVGARRQ
jgi:hypothetical protein